jgi:hypothetical protein
MPSYSFGRAISFGDTRPGQVGFVRFLAEMRLAFALERAEERYILALFDKPIFVGAKKLFCTSFELSETRDMGAFFLLDDALVVPDPATLSCPDKPSFLSLMPHGQTHLIAVHGGPGERDLILLDIGSGESVEPPAAQWYFQGWSVQVNNPVSPSGYSQVYHHAKQPD